MKLCFITVSSKLPPWLSDLAADYQKKMSFWLPVEIHVLGGRGLSRQAQEKKKDEESQLLLNFFKPDDFILLCDEHGKEMDTVKFSQWLERTLGSGKKRLLVVVGGAYGVSEDVKRRADVQMRLSNLTTSHHMAFGFVTEQVYRALTILKNVSYHNG